MYSSRQGHSFFIKIKEIRAENNSQKPKRLKLPEVTHQTN